MSQSFGGLVGSIGNALYDLGNAAIALSDPKTSKSDAQTAVASAAIAVSNLGVEAIAAFSNNAGYVAGVLAAPISVANFSANVFQARDSLSNWSAGSGDINQVFQDAVGVVGAFGGLVQNYGQIGSNPSIVLAGVAIQTYANAVKELNKWAASGCPNLLDFIDDFNRLSSIPLYSRKTINPAANTNFLAAPKAAPLRRDPLILDLDNDGLETVGIDTARPILFDHTGTGLKTASGWVKPDDAFLVIDRNGNGRIDSGHELFGDATPLDAGGSAADGFAALAQEDSNHDGQVTAADARWADLHLWRDLNQDGLTQSDELSTLTDHGITALNVAKTSHSTLLDNGNQIADLGGFLRADGRLGTLGDYAKIKFTTIGSFAGMYTDSMAWIEKLRIFGHLNGQSYLPVWAANDENWRCVA